MKSRHPVFETPITLSPHDTVGDALALLPKRAHRAAFVVDDGRPVGVVTEADCLGVDRFTQVRDVMTTEMVTLRDDVDPRAAFDTLASTRHRLAPVVDADRRARRRAHPHRRAPLHALRARARRRRRGSGSAPRSGSTAT